MKTKIINTALIILAVILINRGGCSYRNVDLIKANAEQVWNRNGYEVIGYEGYQLGTITGQPGGRVWYIVQRKGRPGVTYHGYLSKWGNEFHVYNLKAIDAIQP